MSRFGRRRGVGLGRRFGARTATAAAPSPDQIANLIHWYREDVTLNVAAVSQWTDRVTATAKHLVQATGSRQPAFSASDASLNNQSSITCDGGDGLIGAAAADWTFLHDGTGMTVAIVFRYTGAGTAQVLLDSANGTSNNNGLFVLLNGATGTLQWQCVRAVGGTPTFTTTTAGATCPIDTIHVAVLRYVEGGIPGTSDEYRVRIDGTLRTNGNSTAVPSSGAAAGGLGVMARSNVTAFLGTGGKVSELMIWNRAITTAEIDATLSPYTTTRYAVAA